MILNPVTGMIVWGTTIVVGGGALLYFFRKFLAEVFGVEVADEALDTMVDVTTSVVDVVKDADK